ncbi:serine/threonine protein kinase [Undibacterium sp. LX40W]|uniref:non-specific serine/threonine protein kinase n=1 Tax=Undibacterium nitidum TaxID=2762298 RepID=A0A923KU95_9BURK|nr:MULTISPECIES: serine/threonine-protein kinase [Undibacterium]MBC3883051.1 serine/threonine protein kinase [Undibacterium nitidum]MBC3893332.1 serine/threonine protein kinase [Undibacterium sp. LX40W]
MIQNHHLSNAAAQVKAPMRRIGRFTITDKLGSGSNGNVMLGHDPVIDRPVAIKILNNPGGTADKKQREQQFINEARAAGRLSHPNIVTIYDASTEGGTTFIAMEFLQGKDLRELMSNGKRFDAMEAASIAYKVANALAFAHNQGVIHRDIKPANIFLVENNQPKVVDFGIARVPNRTLDENGQPQTLFKNNIMGTPNYMSPEQASSQPVTALTDVYSLGATLYEMLTNQKPFSASDFDKLLYNIARKTPKSPDLVNPEVPEKLAHIVMKAMQKKPHRRYKSAAEMALALNKFLAKEKRERRKSGTANVISKTTSEISEKSALFWLGWASFIIASILVVLAFQK